MILLKLAPGWLPSPVDPPRLYFDVEAGHGHLVGTPIADHFPVADGELIVKLPISTPERIGVRFYCDGPKNILWTHYSIERDGRVLYREPPE